MDRVALEYALVARSYMGGDAAAYLAEIDQPSSRMARSGAPHLVGIVTSRRGCPRPGRRDRLRPAAPAAGGTTCQMPAVPAPAGPDGASPSSLRRSGTTFLPD
jgi:hypothetical protein